MARVRVHTLNFFMPAYLHNLVSEQGVALRCDLLVFDHPESTDKILSCFCKSIEMVYPHGRLLEPRMMGLAVRAVVHTEKKRRIRFHHFSWTFTGKYSESIDCTSVRICH